MNNRRSGTSVEKHTAALTMLEVLCISGHDTEPVLKNSHSFPGGVSVPWKNNLEESEKRGCVIGLKDIEVSR